MTITKSVARKARAKHNKEGVTMGEAIKEVYAEEKHKPHSHKTHVMHKKKHATEKKHKKHATEKQKHARDEFKKAVKYAQDMMKAKKHGNIAEGVKEYFHMKKK